MSVTTSDRLAAQPTDAFCRHYRPNPELQDEMVGQDGVAYARWQPLWRALDELGVTEFARRWDDARQLIRENGVTYNVYGDPRGLERPLALDPIPLLLAAAEYDALETGLVQRARLLELLLADLYGPQILLREGLLPPELVFAHPGFLRPCHGVRPAGGRFLQLYAANLGRAADGRFRVLGDRTQAPSGAGYALENRLVLSRMLPDVFRECQVKRLAQFFLTIRETLAASAPHNRDNPRVVLLTPGPYNETYFEHAYLAQYLGYALVEGGDLTVRDDRVYLKLLGGLQPVDVILRRLDDDYCDPLELRRDSFLGVPGLMQAVRAGHVAIANPLGSGLIEMPALLGFLPAICQRLLGEPLRLPSVATWWCGTPAERDHVLANLNRLLIKPAFPSSRLDPIFGERLSREQRQGLAERIQARPWEYVGQEQLPLATTPVLANNHLQPRRFVFRTFLTAAGDSFAVMPGGLTRVAATADTPVVSMQQGGGSKDTWVLSSGPVSPLSLLPTTIRPVELSRGGGDLPSRAADNLFWLGRYVERAEGSVRLLRGILVRLTEKAGLAEAPELPALLGALLHHATGQPGDENGKFTGDAEQELRSFIFDGDRLGSLHWTLVALQRVSRMVRDRVSIDIWRILGRINLHEAGEADTAGLPMTLSDILEMLDELVLSLTAFSGLAMENMTRGRGWQFLDMGRRVERAAHTINLLDSTLARVSSAEGPLLEAVLEIADSTMTFRRRYLSSLQAAPVLDLLLADESNPRSLAFQLAALAEHVGDLPRDTSHPEERIVLAARTELRLADVDVLAQPDERGLRPNLAVLLARLGEQLPMLSDKITQNYLTHVQATRQLAGFWQASSLPHDGGG